MISFVLFCTFALLCLAASVMCIEIVQTILGLPRSRYDRTFGYVCAGMCAGLAALSGVAAGYIAIYGASR